MDINKCKNFLPFIVSIILFLIGAIFAGTTLLNMNSPMEKPDSLVEVNLPVVNWAKYGNLSKKLTSDSINIVK